MQHSHHSLLKYWNWEEGLFWNWKFGTNELIKVNYHRKKTTKPPNVVLQFLWQLNPSFVIKSCKYTMVFLQMVHLVRQDQASRSDHLYPEVK